jgi:gamma-glutamyltranspeptidase/glutathione hydrolase
LLPAGAAAGHPATARAGLKALADGGSAADAAVCACIASCVCEVVMTGLLGGGHGIYWDASSARGQRLDFFTAVPGLGVQPRKPELSELEVVFGEEKISYAIGPQSCAVPGVPAGLHELWRRHGRLEWEQLVEPAIGLARDGVSMPPAHASCLRMVAPVLTLDGGERLLAPEGHLLEEGELLMQPGLATALELIANDPLSLYRGELGSKLLELMVERDGLITREDLASYAAIWRDPVETVYVGTRFLTRGELSGVPETLSRLAQLSALRERDRVLAVLDALEGGGESGSHTTNLVTADSDGNACVLTTSLGLGSGDYLPDLDLHLNSMLGEIALISRSPVPGERVGSMMAPSIAVHEDTPVLAIGAAGGTRLRSAIVQVASGILDEGLSPTEAISRPRFHPEGALVNAEPGVSEEVLTELESRGRQVRRWSSLHHYFGGVSAIGQAGAAGDPRRSGKGLLLG